MYQYTIEPRFHKSQTVGVQTERPLLQNFSSFNKLLVGFWINAIFRSRRHLFKWIRHVIILPNLSLIWQHLFSNIKPCLLFVCCSISRKMLRNFEPSKWKKSQETVSYWEHFPFTLFLLFICQFWVKSSTSFFWEFVYDSLLFREYSEEGKDTDWLTRIGQVGLHDLA